MRMLSKTFSNIGIAICPSVRPSIRRSVGLAVRGIDGKENFYGWQMLWLRSTKVVRLRELQMLHKLDGELLIASKKLVLDFFGGSYGPVVTTGQCSCVLVNNVISYLDIFKMMQWKFFLILTS